jgi:UDP-3-O-[3-hydroxymyristoyl] N-acetylglucosamine deacetylase
VELTLRPAPPDTGIVFRRVDLPQPVDIPVNAQSVTDTRMASTISRGDAKVRTVEHLMSACAGLGLDNLYIDITAEEVPILDGSASSFVFLLQSAGIELQKAPKRFLRVLKAVEVREGEGEQLKWALLSPPRLQAQLRDRVSPPGGGLHRPARRVRHGLGRYSRDIARARTFGFSRTSRPCAPTAWRWAAGWTTPS